MVQKHLSYYAMKVCTTLTSENQIYWIEKAQNVMPVATIYISESLTVLLFHYYSLLILNYILCKIQFLFMKQ